MARWTEEERKKIDKMKEEIYRIFEENDISYGIAHYIIQGLEVDMGRKIEMFLNREKFRNI